MRNEKAQRPPSRRARIGALLVISLGALHCGKPAVSATRVSGSILPLHTPAPGGFDDLRGRCVQRGEDQRLTLDVCGGGFGEAIRGGTFSGDADLPVPEQAVEIFRFSAGGAIGGVGAEMDVEIARESVTTKVRSLTSIAVQDAKRLASECLNPALEQELIVTGVHFGCMRSADTATVSGNALEIVKAAADSVRLQTKGGPKSFYSMDGSDPSCEETAPIAVEVLPAKEFCQRHVQPALVQELRDEIEEQRRVLDTCRRSQGSLSQNALAAINGHVTTIQSLTEQLDEVSKQGAAAAAKRADLERQLSKEKREFATTLDESLDQNEGLRVLVNTLSAEVIRLSAKLLEVNGRLSHCLTN